MAARSPATRSSGASPNTSRPRSSVPGAAIQADHDAHAASYRGDEPADRWRRYLHDRAVARTPSRNARRTSTCTPTSNSSNAPSTGSHLPRAAQAATEHPILCSPSSRAYSRPALPLRARKRARHRPPSDTLAHRREQSRGRCRRRRSLVAPRGRPPCRAGDRLGQESRRRAGYDCDAARAVDEPGGDASQRVGLGGIAQRAVGGERLAGQADGQLVVEHFGAGGA